jgi:hypothetical protein
MSTAALERAIADMEASRKAFEAAAVRVSSELEALAERVSEANGKLSSERQDIVRAVAKRRRRSGGGARAQGAATAQGGEADTNPDTDAQTERRFKDTVEDAEERLQTATRTLAASTEARTLCVAAPLHLQPASQFHRHATSCARP